ncbi:MAG: hypothetical protein EKK61_03915 [Rickettsiales bacterium]|nr:MAG: hypothetical protein EKK61_03915 [Rickettsiales bacterium]
MLPTEKENQKTKNMNEFITKLQYEIQNELETYFNLLTLNQHEKDINFNVSNNTNELQNELIPI